MKDLRSFVQVDVVSLMESLDTVTQANMAAMIHSVTVQYLYRAGSKENDTFGKTGSISDVRPVVCRIPTYIVIIF